MENEMTEYEKREDKEKKLKLYYQTKTPTFLKIKYLNSYRVLNGHIKHLYENSIIFDDIQIPGYPIDIDDIIRVDVSRKKELINKKESLFE